MPRAEQQHTLSPRAITRAARTRAALAAAAVITGVLAALAAPDAWISAARAPAALLITAAALLTAGIPLRRARPAAVLIAIACAGAASAIHHARTLPASNLAHVIPAADLTLIEIEGTCESRPQPPAIAPGPLDRFLFARRSPALTLRVQTLITDEGHFPVTGRLRLAAPDLADLDLRPGDRVRALARFTPVTAPSSPGQPDRRATANQQRLAGYANAPAAGLIDRLGQDRSPRAAIDRALDTLRTRAASALTTPGDPENTGSAVTAALVLGARSPALDDPRADFRSAGVAHLLAISGFHLGLLVLAILGAARLVTRGGPIRPLAAAAIVTVYALVVPAEPAIQRAATLAVVLLLAAATGRRFDAPTVLLFTLAAMALARPADVLGMGFQLSFLVTLLLLAASPGHPLLDPTPRQDPERAATEPITRRLARWLAAYTTTCALCWAASAPIAAWHTGQLATFGPIAAVLLTPIAALTLLAGFAAALAGLISPDLAAPPAQLAALLGHLAADTAGALASLPGATINTQHAGPLWPIAATTAGLLCWRARRLVAPGPILALAAAAWLALPIQSGNGLPAHTAARLDMLDVADGSAFLIRTRDAAVLWDCGSLSPGAGRWTVAPAARALGCPTVQTAIITHDNTDHYAGLPRAIDELGITEVLISAPALRAMRAASPSSAAKALLAELTARDITPTPLAAGDTIRLGPASLNILWPPADLDESRAPANDCSLIASLRVTTEGPQRTIVLTGDAGPTPLAAALDQLEADLPIDALELPHHGSFNQTALRFVQQTAPAVVLQSTGKRRLGDPRWANARAALSDRAGQWLISAEQGAAFAAVDRASTLRAGPSTDQPRRSSIRSLNLFR